MDSLLFELNWVLFPLSYCHFLKIVVRDDSTTVVLDSFNIR